MNQREALSRIRATLQQFEPRLTPPAGVPYATYCQQQRTRLLAAVIDPVKVSVTACIIQDPMVQRCQTSCVWGIARIAKGRLLTLEHEVDFALAFGDNSNALMMHGCASADALTEWCS